MLDTSTNSVTEHFGRQLLHWLKHSGGSWYSTFGEDFVDNIKNFERGVAVIDYILTPKEEEIASVISDLEDSDDFDIYQRSHNDMGENQQQLMPTFYEHFNRRNVITGNNNGSISIQSPPHSNVQRERDVTQNCSSLGSSPLGSPGALSSTSFCMPASGATSIVDTADPNWQAAKPTVRERNLLMFNNELMADIKFIVGTDDQTQTIPAHKYILATGSSVFYAMFYGGLAENDAEIRVPDVEPAAFLILLKYLYCDEINLEADNVLSTLYVAKKYIVPHLAKACVNFLETSLTAKNACLLLSQSRLFEEPDLMQRCWEVIDAQAEMAVKSEGFVDIDLRTFETILTRETLNCKEISLFEAALNWAQAQCQKLDIEPTAQNRRQMLGKALYLIRIPTMTLEQFANRVAQLGVLTHQETIDIFLNFTAKQKPKLEFSTKKRMGLETQVCHRFQSCAYRSNQWRYRGRCDSIQFSVDKRVFIIGFGLYGSSTGAADYNVKIDLKRLGRVLGENSTKFFSDGSSNTFYVYFDNPIQCEPECFYTASVILDGSELSFFGQEGMTEVTVGTVTFQFQCSSESTNGTGVQGGQIPELIFYGPTTTLVASPSNQSVASLTTNNNNNNNNTPTPTTVSSASNDEQ